MSLKIIVLAKQVPDTRNVGKDAMKEDGTRCDKEGKVIMEHPENTFGGWSSDVLAWML